jgi:hypothetical protein
MAPLARHVEGTGVRMFVWWFGMGALMTLSVLMIQGGVHDLIYQTHPTGSANAVLTFTMTILGGGLLAGCLALVMSRLR